MDFTEKAFRKWLESKTDLKRVGYPEYTNNCPLCQFLREQGASIVWMSIMSRRVDEGFSLHNPQWSIDFQLAACKFVESDPDRQITAKRALSFLEAS